MNGRFFRDPPLETFVAEKKGVPENVIKITRVTDLRSQYGEEYAQYLASEGPKCPVESTSLPIESSAPPTISDDPAVMLHQYAQMNVWVRALDQSRIEEYVFSRHDDGDLADFYASCVKALHVYGILIHTNGLVEDHCRCVIKNKRLAIFQAMSRVSNAIQQELQLKAPITERSVQFSYVQSLLVSLLLDGQVYGTNVGRRTALTHGLT